MITPSQNPSELDKAVEEVANWNNHRLTAARPSRQAVDQLLLAAKRLKEVENSLETEKLLVKGLEGNLKACEDMLKEVEKDNGRLSTTIVRLMADNNEQSDKLSTLHTEYKNALEAIVKFNNLASPLGTKAYTDVMLAFEEVLSTPHAIAAMKKDK